MSIDELTRELLRIDDCTATYVTAWQDDDALLVIVRGHGAEERRSVRYSLVDTQESWERRVSGAVRDAHRALHDRLVARERRDRAFALADGRHDRGWPR